MEQEHSRRGCSMGCDLSRHGMAWLVWKAWMVSAHRWIGLEYRGDFSAAQELSRKEHKIWDTWREWQGKHAQKDLQYSKVPYSAKQRSAVQ